MADGPLSGEDTKQIAIGAAVGAAAGAILPIVGWGIGAVVGAGIMAYKRLKK